MIKKSYLKGTVLIVSLLAFGLLWSGSNIKAGNYQDSWYSTYYNGDGSDVFTNSRGKWDYTSSYSYNSNSTYAYYTQVYGNNSGANYGWYYTYGSPRLVRVGYSSYHPNLVKESGLNYAGLGLQSVQHRASYIGIWWSPDSI